MSCLLSIVTTQFLLATPWLIDKIVKFSVFVFFVRFWTSAAFVLQIEIVKLIENLGELGHSTVFFFPKN